MIIKREIDISKDHVIQYDKVRDKLSCTTAKGDTIVLNAETVKHLASLIDKTPEDVIKERKYVVDVLKNNYWDNSSSQFIIIMNKKDFKEFEDQILEK